MESQTPSSSKNTNKILMAGIGGLLVLSGGYLVLSSSVANSNTPGTPEKKEATPFQASVLKIEADGEATEGQIEPLKLALAQESTATSLEVTAQDTSYLGKPMTHKHTLNTAQFPQELPFVFQSPGKKKIHIKTSDGQVLKTLDYEVKPFAASVFPKEWSKNKVLKVAQGEENPYKIYVNLFYDAKTAPEQRQYLQVTYKDQIVDRFLISSGAKGYDTPKGEFQVGFKDFYPRSAKYGNTPMPFWSSIKMNGKEGEYGFHSLEDGGYLYLLGKPASHGCVRLSRKASVETDPKTGKQFWGDRGGARWIYDRVPEDTSVTIMSHKRDAFEYQDYHKYLVAQAKAYAEKQAKKKEKKVAQST